MFGVIRSSEKRGPLDRVRDLRGERPEVRFFVATQIFL